MPLQEEKAKTRSTESIELADRFMFHFTPLISRALRSGFRPGPRLRGDCPGRTRIALVTVPSARGMPLPASSRGCRAQDPCPCWIPAESWSLRRVAATRHRRPTVLEMRHVSDSFQTDPPRGAFARPLLHARTGGGFIPGGLEE